MYFRKELMEHQNEYLDLCQHQIASNARQQWHLQYSIRKIIKRKEPNNLHCCENSFDIFQVR